MRLRGGACLTTFRRTVNEHSRDLTINMHVLNPRNESRPCSTQTLQPRAFVCAVLIRVCGLECVCVRGVFVCVMCVCVCGDSSWRRDSALHAPHRTRQIEHIASYVVYVVSASLPTTSTRSLGYYRTPLQNRSASSSSQAAGGHERTRAGESWCNDADCGKSVKHLAWHTRLSRDLSVPPPL